MATDPTRQAMIVSYMGRILVLAPEMRVCQMIGNALGLMGLPVQDPYYVEDEILEQGLERLLAHVKANPF